MNSKAANAQSLPRTFSPPEVARHLGVKPERVIRWIRAGELRGIDMSAQPGVGRPRFRVDPADLEVFKNSRCPTAPAKPKRRRTKQPEVIEFF